MKLIWNEMLSKWCIKIIWQSIYNRNLMKIILKSNPLWISMCMIFNKQNPRDWYYIKMIILKLLLRYPNVGLLGVTSFYFIWDHCVRILIWKGMKQFPHPQDSMRKKKEYSLSPAFVDKQVRWSKIKIKKIKNPQRNRQDWG